jgi:uncharacterized protein YegJ (DUF2314 family)
MRILLLSCVVVLAACSGETADPEAEYQRDLAAATKDAQTKLPYFWEHFEAPLVDEYDFSLKAAIPRRDGQPGAEDVWLEYIAKGDGKIVGELQIDPRYLGELREGAVVEFQESQIVDWSFLRGNLLLGHYTTRVMLPRLDQLQQDYLRPMFEASPDPAPPP